MRSPLRVALAGDDTPLLRALRRALRRLGHDSCSCPPTAESLLALPSVDIAMLVLEAPKRRQLEPIGSLVRKLGATPLVIVGNPPAERDSARRIAEGGASFLAAADLAEHLEQVLRMAASGYRVLPHDLGPAPRAVLTAREKQILGLVVMGLSNAQIASRLFVEETTVKTHLSSVFEKLGVGSRREAAALVLDPATGLGSGILVLGDAVDVDVVPLPARLGERAAPARLAS